MERASILKIKDDFTAGIVVFLVAIPLCLGIAYASNAPLLAGLISGIVGGIVVGILSQSQISVSGPAAGMVAVILAAVAQLGGYENFLLALILAGIIQIIVGVLRAGFIGDYIPSNVIQGLLCAIGLLIVIKQLPLAFTHAQQDVSLTTLLKQSAQTLDISVLFALKNHINGGATLITLLSLAVLIFNDRTTKSYFKKIPGPIVVVLLGIVLNEIYMYFLPGLTQSSVQLVNIPLNESYHQFFKQLISPNWPQWRNPNIYFYAFIIAAVASLETLLNLEATEKLDSKRKYCSRNRELFAQGVGNTISGLLGGLPITSVVVRSSVNIQAGAKSKLSTIFHGIFLLAAILFIPGWLNKIPLASLAAILIYVGYKLVMVSAYRAFHKQSFMYYFPFIVTVVTIVMTNLLLGILVGLVCSICFILKQYSQMRFDIVEESHPSGVVRKIILPQQLSFLQKASLIAELQAIPKNSRLVIDARFTKFIDTDILELIKDFYKNIAAEKEIEINLIGFKDYYKISNRINFINVTTYDVQSTLVPSEIIKILREGNQRFITDQRINRYFPSEVKATAKNQHPLAVILSCIDSRVPVETIFDMGVGDLFVVRVAGNVVNEDVIGSIEFACRLAHAKLIIVLGHTSCGAVKAACDYHGNGYIQKLLSKIQPAVDAVQPEKKSEVNEAMLTNIIRRNTANSLMDIYQTSQTIKDLVDSEQIGLVSALYDIRSGFVDFYDNLAPIAEPNISSEPSANPL